MGRREHEERKRKAAARSCKSLDSSWLINSKKQPENPDVASEAVTQQQGQNEGRFLLNSK